MAAKSRAARLVAVTSATVASLSFGFAGQAAAREYEPTQEFVPASACFSTAEPSGAVAFYNDPVLGGIGLACGDPTIGIIHIDMDHPIAEDGSDDDNVGQCFINIITSPERQEVPASEGHTAYESPIPGGNATLVYTNDTQSTRTMFTSNTGNNWAACAAA